MGNEQDNKGSGMKEVLDIGAGRYPCPGATRAIDPLKRYIVKTRATRGDIVRPKSLHEYRCAKAEKIPYPDGFFNKVISRWALGFCIWRRQAYQEIARVLKPNGRIEVRLLWKNRRYKKHLIEKLEEVGINVYAEYKGIYIQENPKDFILKKPRQLTEFVICGRKNHAKTVV